MAKPKRKGIFVTDPNFLAQQRTIHKLFTTHQGSFEAFDAGFAAPFADNWLASIIEFEDISTDETMRDEVQECVEASETKRKQCNLKLLELMHYVHKAFPNNSRKLQEFGFNPRSVAPNPGILQFALEMTGTRMITADYISNLTAVGMPAALPGQLDDLNDELFGTITRKVYQQRMRLRTTDKRINQYNALWNTYDLVRKAAQVIYYGNPTSRQLFELEVK